MNLTVYCSAREVDNENYKKAAKKLGEWIAANNHSLVYGGSNTGLMKILADAVLDGGAEVTGVELKLLDERGFTYDRIKNIKMCETLSERRSVMVALGDAFAALPGGLGTLDEISEVIELMSLKEKSLIKNGKAKSIIFFNIDGCYEQLKLFMERGVRDKLIEAEDYKNIHFLNSVDEMDGLFD